MAQPRSEWWSTIGLVLAFGVAILAIAANWVLDGELAAMPVVQTDGVVVLSEMRTRANKQKTAEVVVSYEVGGRKFKTSNDMFGIVGDDRLGAAGLLDRYAEGAVAAVWYVPEEPSTAFLRRPSPPSPWGYILGLAAAVLLFAVILRWRWLAHRGARA